MFDSYYYAKLVSLGGGLAALCRVVRGDGYNRKYEANGAGR